MNRPRPYKLGTGVVSGEQIPLALVGGSIYPLRMILGSNSPSTLLGIVSEWGSWEPQLSDAILALDSGTLGGGLNAQDIAYLAPIPETRKIVCIGTNYKDHLAEMKVASLPAYPYSFLRTVTSLAGHKQTIALPSLTRMVDWEAELGVVIGRRIGPGDAAESMSAVAGYTVINDISARDWIESRPFVGIDWVMQKSWDHFQPTGPWLTPAQFVSAPQQLAIKLMVNGIVKQSSNTSQMIFGVREIIRHLSSMMTLEPGDLIATGTPAGVGYGRTPREFLRAGDVVEITIEGLGTLVNAFA